MANSSIKIRKGQIANDFISDAIQAGIDDLQEQIELLNSKSEFAIDTSFTGSSGWFTTLNTLYPEAVLGYTVYAINVGGSYACRKLSATEWVISPIEGIVTQS